MNLPTGIEAGYGFCLVWFLIEFGLYSLLHQTGSLDSLRDSATAGTFKRLAPLNEFLTGRFDEWTGPAQGGDEDAPLIRDRVTLMDLKQSVDSAAKFETMQFNRVRFEELGRLVVVVSLFAPFVTAGLVLFNFDRALIAMLALGAFIILTAGVLVAVLLSQVLRIRIVSGTGA